MKHKTGFFIDCSANLFYRHPKRIIPFHQLSGSTLRKINALTHKILRKLSNKAARVGCADGKRISFSVFLNLPFSRASSFQQFGKELPADSGRG
jgi:hypothetical protein